VLNYIRVERDYYLEKREKSMGGNRNVVGDDSFLIGNEKHLGTSLEQLEEHLIAKTTNGRLGGEKGSTKARENELDSLRSKMGRNELEGESSAASREQGEKTIKESGFTMKESWGTARSDLTWDQFVKACGCRNWMGKSQCFRFEGHDDGGQKGTVQNSNSHGVLFIGLTGRGWAS